MANGNVPDRPSEEVLPPPPMPADNRTVLVHVVYGLYALAALTAFPALVGVILAYFGRAGTAGTWLDSHAGWQIRTFWYGLLLNIVGWITTFILIGWAILGLAWLWFIWRIAKGWIRLAHGQPVEDHTSFF